MMAFPPVLPDSSWRFSIRLPRDHYVRVARNDYSVNPRFVGRRVEVQVSLEEVIVTCQGTEIGRHRRFLGKHQTLLAVDHARVLRAMREEAAVPVPVAETTVDERALSRPTRNRQNPSSPSDSRSGRAKPDIGWPFPPPPAGSTVSPAPMGPGSCKKNSNAWAATRS